MEGTSSYSTAMIQPRVNRLLGERDYGREEYVEDCISQMLEGKEVLVTLGGIFEMKSLPPILRQKYKQLGRAKDDTGCVFFGGFEKAKEEIVNKVMAMGHKVICREFLGGSNSDICDMPNSLDGHFLRIVKA
jgi:hypothetical protein